MSFQAYLDNIQAKNGKTRPTSASWPPRRDTPTRGDCASAR